MAYTSITVEGGLFPSDLLDRIATGDAEGQKDKDFALDGGRLTDEIQSAFSDMRAYWDAFQRRLQHAGDRATSITRESWIIPLLERLGYQDHGGTIVLWRPAPQVDGVTYAISHRAGEDEDAPPVHIVSIEQPLDRKAEGSRRNPHATVQEFLNRSPALWGIVTNGKVLRVLRDTQLVSRPTYLELDLQAMVEGNLYSEFVLLYRLIQRTRLPGDGTNPDECLLETYYQQGLDEGGRVREHLREGVEAALEELGTALLTHPGSERLREALCSGELDAAEYYRQLLRLIYRLLFLMVVEERKLLFPSETGQIDGQRIYTEHYSVARLRERAETRRFADDRYSDLWEGLRQTFLLLREDDLARPLGLAALNGELFGGNACRDLESASCENRHLLAAIYRLSTFQDGKVRRRVNYAGLDVEELGSVYESLLELHPRIELDPEPHFNFIRGSERKQTGSYYTPPQLVRELIESVLVPVMEDHLKSAGSRDEKEAALLELRVVDPASGSGHFLLAAARRVARELAKVRSGDDEPAPEAYRAALRDVIRCCVYAVDKNPLAIDLCKVALWIEGYNAGMPLSFLDNHIKHGDSLVGVFDLNVLAEGIPHEAYTAVTGDDKAVASLLRKRNKREREGEQTLSLFSAETPDTAKLAQEYRRLGLQEEHTPYDVHEKEHAYEKLRSEGGDWWRDKVACDLWTAAFFMQLKLSDNPAEESPTTGTVRSYLAQSRVPPAQLGAAVALSQTHPFFHWPLEFPDVFERGGFDVVLGNPPWEQVQIRREEFFAERDPEIARAQHKAARASLIAALDAKDPALSREFDRSWRQAEGDSKFARGSGRFPLCGHGNVTTYSLFAELSRGLMDSRGAAGAILPSGIATDDRTKVFFQNVMDKRVLVSLYDFENRQKIFPAVDSRMKFCLLTLAGEGRPARQAEFAFFIHNTEELRDTERRFTLSPEDMALVNPNTRTCPIFRTWRDAEITKAIYQRVPVLLSHAASDGNPWRIELVQGLFNMSHQSHLFRTRADLETEGWCLEGSVFVRGGDRYLPLYEAKMTHQFDHRWATYDGVESRDVTTTEKSDPHAVALSRYWVSKREVDDRLRGKWDRGWLLGWRDITNSTNERTVIATVLPRVGVGNNEPLMLLDHRTTSLAPALVACLSSFVLDFTARFKVGGTHLNFFIINQLPVLPHATYDKGAQWSPGERLQDWIAPRVLALTYTAWDMAPFARDLGYHGPPSAWDGERRFLLRCELDAAFFHLYGIAREDVDYIMETFPIVKRKDEAKHGEYRTKRVILEMYDAMRRSMDGGVPYRGVLQILPATAARGGQ
jgi:hypothetical protein